MTTLSNYDREMADLFPTASVEPATADFEIDLRSREDVRWMQQVLNRALGTALEKDGIYGPRTRAALVRFQGDRGLAADGIPGPKTEAALRDAQARRRSPRRRSGRRGQRRTGSRKQLAQRVLDNPRIQLHPQSPVKSSSSDGADARSNIEATAAGRPAKRSAYGTAPGGTVKLDERILRALVALGEEFSIYVTSIAGGSHSKDSRHYSGIAIDIGAIDQRQVSARHSKLERFVRRLRELGAEVVLGPGIQDHDNHIHAAWSRDGG